MDGSRISVDLEHEVGVDPDVPDQRVAGAQVVGVVRPFISSVVGVVLFGCS